jgi:hypothetical protein
MQCSQHLEKLNMIRLPQKATKNHLPESNTNNPFNNDGNMKKKKQLEHVHLLPNFNDTNTITLPSMLVHWWVWFTLPYNSI